MVDTADRFHMRESLVLCNTMTEYLSHLANIRKVTKLRPRKRWAVLLQPKVEEAQNAVCSCSSPLPSAAGEARDAFGLPGDDVHAGTGKGTEASPAYAPP